MTIYLCLSLLLKGISYKTLSSDVFRSYFSLNFSSLSLRGEGSMIRGLNLYRAILLAIRSRFYFSESPKFPDNFRGINVLSALILPAGEVF